MRFTLAAVFAATGLCFAATAASAEIIELNAVSAARTTIIRGAPDRCHVGPSIIRVGEAISTKPVRCAVPSSYQTNVRVQINNFVAVFLDDRHKRHYKRSH